MFGLDTWTKKKKYFKEKIENSIAQILSRCVISRMPLHHYDRWSWYTFSFKLYVVQLQQSLKMKVLFFLSLISHYVQSGCWLL